MANSSKKRSFLKLRKLGKFLKLKRSKKQEITELRPPEPKTKSKAENSLQITTDFDRETPQESINQSMNEIAKPNEITEGAHHVEESVDFTAQDTRKDSSVHVPLHNHEALDHAKHNANYIISTVEVHTPPNESESSMLPITEEKVEENKELPYAVIVHTPPPRQTAKKKIDLGEHEKDLVLPDMTCTPLPKIKGADEEANGFLAMAQSPSPKQSQKKSRVLTVKKIRSIIATPYKRLKRESSLLDGQTYRYIEIQSLVNAFQTMHAGCIGSMIAANEKGLQYGMSSVLRIECKECNTVVFLQVSKS